MGNPNSPTQRLGPFIGYTFFHKKPGTTMFNNPTILLLSQWYIAHRYRAGRERSGAIPHLALGFAFNGDFWSSGR